MRLVHLGGKESGSIAKDISISQCGCEFNAWETENLETINHENVTCKNCMRSAKYKELKALAKTVLEQEVKQIGIDIMNKEDKSCHNCKYVNSCNTKDKKIIVKGDGVRCEIWEAMIPPKQANEFFRRDDIHAPYNNKYTIAIQPVETDNKKIEFMDFLFKSIKHYGCDLMNHEIKDCIKFVLNHEES